MKILLIISFLFSFGTLAKDLNAKEWLKKFSWISSSEMPRLIKKARKRSEKRKIASYRSIDIKSMSSKYKQLIEDVTKANSSEQVAKMLNELEGKFDSLPQDAKFLATQLLLLKSFRGIFYRFIPLAEKERITHSFLRNSVKTLISNLRVYLPFEHWEAGFNYLAEPFKTKAGLVVQQFKDSSVKGKKSLGVHDMQTFLWKEIYVDMARAVKRIKNLDLSTPVIWDNRVVFGSESFKDDFEETRFRKVGEGEKLLALSSLHFGMHYLNQLIAYELKGSFSLAKDIGKLYGIDGFFAGDVLGVPSARWVKKVKDKKYKKLGTLREGGYEHNMLLAYQHLKQGVRYLRLGREEVRNEPADGFFVINPNWVNPFDENIEKQFKGIECLTDDSSNSCPIRSAITGHTVLMSLDKFYRNPPRDLKSFLPTAWETSSAKMLKKHGKSYPNYSWGTPNNWDYQVYKKHFFPNMKNAKSIPLYIRTLRQSFGGEVLGAPFALFIE